MREWYLQRDALPSVILAADARLSPLNYFDDQIWELNLRSGEPAALSLQTTYGLRARNMRLFPRFTEGDKSITDPDRFSSPPAIHRFFPNYVLVTCSPFPGIDVVCEYWAPFSNVMGGRIRVINSGVTPRSMHLEWVAILVPSASDPVWPPLRAGPAGEGHRMTPEKIQVVNVLQGQLQGLSPVVFMTGGAEANHSPYPSLSVSMDLLPGLDRQFVWMQAALANPEASFTLARTTATRDWDAEYARIEMTNASQVEIETGNPSWNVAFALGQKTAFNLIHGPTEHLPHPSYVQTRLPDQGFSLRGDGSDYDHLWDGQTVLETWYLCNQLLPSSPKLAQGLLQNFLATQDETGYVDWKPGLNGRRSGFLSTPLLCSLAWRIYQVSQDQTFLKETFTPLLRFFDNWFAPHHDRDNDGIPEWDHPVQTGFEDNPLFAYWQPWSQGADITLFESPALNAMLYHEGKSLLKIARTLGRLGPVYYDLEARLDVLETVLERAWNPETAAYSYRDCVSHSNAPGKMLGRRKGSGTLGLSRFNFDQPARLLVRVHPSAEGSRDTSIRIHGVDARQQEIVERIPPEDFRWSLGIGTGVSKQVYARLEQIRIENITPEDRVFVHTVDYSYHDQTLLSPLWAGVPTQEQAEVFIKKQIMRPNRYWQSHGLSACPASGDRLPEAAAICDSVWVPWNSLVGEGLV
ncbi:MAG: hypothetical protein ACE5GO_08655, partial [Anaerolineales bacterium]